MEFAALLLKTVGPSKITASVVDILFSEIDNDNDGWIRIEELRIYILHGLHHKQQKSRGRYRFVLGGLIRDTSILGSFSFICSSIISMVKNKFSRFYIDHVLAAVACEFGMWISFLGANIFVGRAIYNARVQVGNIMPRDFSGKVPLLARMLFTLDTVSLLSDHILSF